MIKKIIFGLICGALLVILAFGKSRSSVEHNDSREYNYNQCQGDDCTNGAHHERGCCKRIPVQVDDKERVGAKLRAQELNEEDVD